MKKLLSALIAVLFIMGAFAYAETASPAEPLEEGQMYFHVYNNANAGYLVGVPAEWALIGLHSTADNLNQAYDLLGYSEVQSLLNQLNEENDLLFCASSDGDQMVLTYGKSDGITTETLLKEIETFKEMLLSSYTGIEFKEDCGSVKINELLQVMYIGAKYKSHDISQYFIPAGANIFVFTFTDVAKDIELAVLNNFVINP